MQLECVSLHKPIPQPGECSVAYIGRVYGIEAIEFDDRVTRNVLVCAGTGLMLSLMDQCPALRWCIDVDGLSSEQLERLPDWLACVHKVTDFVAIAGWYCATNPVPLAKAARMLDAERMRCYVQCHGRGDPFPALRTSQSLEDFVAQVNAKTQAARQGFCRAA